MREEKYELWENIPGTTNSKPYITRYIPDKVCSRHVLVIFPGSGYRKSPSIPTQEGKRIAEYFCNLGINVFVLEYRVTPDYFPLPILDGRRAIRFIKYHSKKFGIDKDKIALMGFSSGGHLAASTSSYSDRIDYEDIDDVDKEGYIPFLQILCYPVITLNEEKYFAHNGSGTRLLGDSYEELKDVLSMENTMAKSLPPTFIWHNFDDTCVSVVNSLKYAEKLRKLSVPVEMHIFPDGEHGIGLPVDNRKDYNHNKKWIDLLRCWLRYNNFNVGEL